MTETTDYIRREERAGESIITYFRIVLGIIYCISVGIGVFRAQGSARLGVGTYIGIGLFFIYSALMFWHVHKQRVLQPALKYGATFLDLGFMSLIILSLFSRQMALPMTLFIVHLGMYGIVIMLGMLRRHQGCGLCSGFMALIWYIGTTLALQILGYTQTINYGALGFGSAFLVITGGISAALARQYLHMLHRVAEKEQKIESTQAALKTVLQTKEIAKTIRNSTNEISQSSKELCTTANSQAASVEEIASTIDENAKIASDIADKTGSVATIAAKMEEDVLTGFSVLKNNIKKMGDIKEKNDGVISGIVLLGNKIAKIRDIVQVINAITNQTKVIAFNAALEAASAGETGKRFAVVAGEVNRLADDVANLTKQIREQVEEIQNSSSSLIISSEEGADNIAEGYKLIKELEDVFMEIRSGAEITSNQAQTITVSTQKQRKSSEQITIAITDISRGLNNFLHSTEVATSSAERLTKLAHTLESVLHHEEEPESHGNQ
ncbi:MAG: methyl-accepting chemotaxis protein [Spirochaetaceae bacterium]|jgi:methyl-accepting chemotaxis protein|nr:methyl-accepting chemotaxis protein [Spirochaetaceae bacterium]